MGVSARGRGHEFHRGLLIAHLWEDFFITNLHVNFGYGIFRIFGTGLEPLMLGITVMLLYWLILFWMYRKRLFLRI